MTCWITIFLTEIIIELVVLISFFYYYSKQFCSDLHKTIKGKKFEKIVHDGRLGLNKSKDHSHKWRKLQEIITNLISGANIWSPSSEKVPTTEGHIAYNAQHSQAFHCKRRKYVLICHIGVSSVDAPLKFQYNWNTHAYRVVLFSSAVYYNNVDVIK